ncbi:hypothetical protein DL96DRAFT_1635636 [Flagelloscypha sp. PMI_526]|nr:hypothetical protein DL96DRAFT_1635636 [Flagelloscypha sp. PMI_526]
MLPNVPPHLFEVVQEHIQAVNLTVKIEFAALTILIWDYLLTFNLELSLIWSKKFSVGIVLFLLTRYLPLADILVSIICIQLQDAGNSRDACPGPYAAIVWLDVVGIQIAECKLPRISSNDAHDSNIVILVLRTWALYGQNKWILTGLLTWQAASLVYCGVANQGVIQSIAWGGPELPGIPGCSILSADNLRGRIAGNYVGIVALETVILILTCIRAFCSTGAGHGLSGGSLLFQIIHRDGLVFYFFILGTSVVNLVVLFTAPLQYFAVLIIFQRTMHSVATGRILLHIRQVAAYPVVHIRALGSNMQGREVWQLDSLEESVSASFPRFASDAHSSERSSI